MKFLKNLLPLILCIAMVLSFASVTVYGAGGSTNVAVSASKSEVNVGDTFTVTLEYSAMTVKTFTAGVKFDNNLVECISMEACDPEYPDDFGLCTKRGFTQGSISTIAQANQNSKIGFGVASTDDISYKACTIFIATFKALKSGTANFTSYEDSDGTDAFVSTNIDTVSVTIKGASEPECNHEGKTYTYEANNDGTHKVICSCGETVEADEPCDINKSTKECYDCGAACLHLHFAASSVKYDYNGNGTHIHKVLCNYCNDWGVKDAAQACEDANGDGACDLCGGNYTAHTHSFTTVSGTPATCTNYGTKDYYVCSCGYYADAEGNVKIGDTIGAVNTWLSTSGDNGGLIEKEDHGYNLGFRYTSDGADTNTHTKYCKDCGEAIEGEKNIACEDASGDNNHACDANCGNTSVTAHTPESDDGDCTTPVLCTECGTETTAAKTHVAGEDDGDCTTPVKCVNCSKNAIEAKTHADAENDDDHICDNDGCNIECSTHTGGTATCVIQAVCTECGKSYGELDPANHIATEDPFYENNGDGTHKFWIGCWQCDTKLNLMKENDPCIDSYDNDGKCDCCGAVMHTCTLTHVEAKAATCSATGNIEYWYCSDETCGKYYSDANGENEITDKTSVTIPVDANNHGKTKGFRLDDNGDGTHSKRCNDCDSLVKIDGEDKVNHICDHNNHVCECGAKVPVYVVITDYNDFDSKLSDLVQLTDEDNDGRYTATVILKKKTIANANGNIDFYVCHADGTKCDAHPGAYFHIDNSDYRNLVAKFEYIINENGENVFGLLETSCMHTYDNDYKYEDNKDGSTHTVKYSCCGQMTDDSIKQHDYTTDEDPYTCICGAKFTGWENKCYIKDAVILKGWNEIEGNWYYLDSTTGVRAEGLTRVPYPETAINGVTYAPNAEDVTYHANKEIAFEDADEAWFVFGEDGKFQNNKTGLENGKYIENGMIAWHPGFVNVGGTWYYFVADTNNGGNKFAQGQIYVTRNAEAAGYKSGDQLVFKDGKVDTTVNGIIDGYYYISGQLVVGEGLVKLDGSKYIFVRSAGQLAIGDYWVTPDKANGIVEGGMLYNFGADGYLTIDPTKNGIVDGTYYKEGVPYYAGLIEIDGETYYVKSNGEIAKGWYYVTKTNGIELETNKLFFDEEGKMVELKNGIHEGTDGKLYYYVNGEATGVGLIEIDGDIYYVRTTNGEVVTGTYYIAATNGIEGFENGDKLTFGADGKLVK